MILHSDISAGYSPSIFNAMRVAIHASKALSLSVNETNYQTLTHQEAFYLATLGGARGLPAWRITIKSICQCGELQLRAFASYLSVGITCFATGDTKKSYSTHVHLRCYIEMFVPIYQCSVEMM